MLTNNKWIFGVLLLAIVTSNYFTSTITEYLEEDEELQPNFLDLPDEVIAWKNKGKFLRVFSHDVFVIDSVENASSSNLTIDDTLLILHGFPTSCFDYRNALTHLHKKWHRIVLFDFLGFGLSDKPRNFSYSLIEHADVAMEVWHQLGITGGHLMAHDMGDSVATELLARREKKLFPKYFNDFITVTFNNGGIHREFHNPRVSQILLRMKVIGPIAARLMNRYLTFKQVRSVLGDPESLDDHELDLWWKLMNFKKGKLIMHKLIRYLEDRITFQHRWLGCLTRLDIPTFLVWGRLDTVAPPIIAETLLNEIPNVKVAWLWLGHFGMAENPKMWAEAVIENFHKWL